MKTPQELYNERLNRIKTAVALGKPDRVPVVPLGDSFCALHLGVKVSELCTIPEVSSDTMLKSFTTLGDVDGIQHAAYNVNMLSTIWLSKVKIPGRDLPENELWQVQEEELMKVEDYDAIINGGYNNFIANYWKDRLDNLGDRVMPFFGHVPVAMKKMEDAGVVPFSPIIFTIPYEIFCGGRSMAKFTRDLYKMPDKVQAAMDAAMPEILETARQVLRAFKPVGAWVGGWRSASEFLSPKLWQRFVWPYMKQLALTVLEEGVIPVFHMDSNWTRDIECFLEMPKGKCVFSPDGATDIYKAKEILGDHMCIMGDVSAAMLTLGTPEEVYAYSKKLINDIGPSGFILAQGCCIPINAKPENVAAMIKAATDM